MITVCGANATLEDLRQIPLEKPKGAGRYWMGIQHGELVDTLMGCMSERGWVYNDARFHVGQTGSELVGAMDVYLPDADAPDGQSLALGFFTSNAMKRKLVLYMGTSIFICSNGMATGDMVLNRRHTTGLDLASEIRPALDVYTGRAKTIPGMVARLRDTRLEDDQAAALIVAAGRKGWMPWQRLGQVAEQYFEPNYPDPEDHGRGTSWTLLNAFTEIVKHSSPFAQMDHINRFRNALPGAVVLPTVETLAV